MMTMQHLTRTKAAKTAVSLLFFALFFLLQALVASPGLHHHLHHDADQPDHECAITLLLQGNLEAASSFTPVAVPAAMPAVIFSCPTCVPVAVDYRLLPGRAPPSVRA